MLAVPGGRGVRMEAMMTEQDEQGDLIPRRELQSMVVEMFGDLRELRAEVARLQRTVGLLAEQVKQGRLL